MGTLIRFELKKVLGNKAGVAACALAYALLVALAVAMLTTTSMRDHASGRIVHGLEAQQAYRLLEESHSGLLSDERIAADVATLERANQLAKETPGVFDLSEQEIIDTYGLELWQQTFGIINQHYYYEVVGTLDCASPRATSIQDGVQARLDGALDEGFEYYFPYSESERAYWHDKAQKVDWPIEYGYAGGWKNANELMDWAALAIIALCIALCGSFAGEYQNRTAAVVLPTKRGKSSLPTAKAVAAFIFTTVYWWFTVLSTLAIYLATCGADGASLPVQVVTHFDNPYPLTACQAVFMEYLLGYLLSLGMAAFTLFLSSRMRSTVAMTAIPMAMVFLGAFGTSINPIAKYMILTPMSAQVHIFTHSMPSYAVGSLVLDLPSLLAILYGTATVLFIPLAMRIFKRHQVA